MSLRLSWVRNEVTKSECAHDLGAKSPQNVKLRERGTAYLIYVWDQVRLTQNTMAFAEYDYVQRSSAVYIVGSC